MAVGHQDMEGWGVYSIFKEAGRLLYRHTRTLHPFILAFLLPLALMLFLEVIGIAWLLTWVADQVQPHHLGGISGHHRHSGFHAFHTAFFKAANPHDPAPVFALKLLLFLYTLIFLIFTISWLLVSLATAAIAKAIHHIYSSNNSNTSPNEDDGNSSSQSQSQTQTQTQFQSHSIPSSLPRSLFISFIMSLCFTVVHMLPYILLDLPFRFLLSGPQFEPYHLQTLHSWIWYLVRLILHFWFMVSFQVVVLESRYDGWVALQRSAKLVKAKVATSLGLLTFCFVYFCVLDWILIVAMVIPARWMTLYVYVVAVAVAVGYFAFGAVGSAVVTVFYFASMREGSGGRGEEGGRQAEECMYQAMGVSFED